MKKVLFLLILLPFTTLAASPTRVPFYLGGWEQVVGRQFETVLDGEGDQPGIDLHTFWKAYDPEKIRSEALAYLKKSMSPAGFWTTDPEDYEISITAIRVENLQFAPAVLPRSWYVVVELSAWGKSQFSGLPLWFQLVLIPGKGFKAPTMAEKWDWPNKRPDGTSAKAPPSNPRQGAAVPHP